MERILNKVKSGHAYYKDQMNVYARNKDIKEVIKTDLQTLKDS